MLGEKDDFQTTLVKIKENNPKFTKLNLDRKNITESNIITLIDALQDNNYIKELSLQANNLTEVAVFEIIDFLKRKNKSIISINLSINGLIGDLGVQDLAKFLETDTSLQSVRIGYCFFADLGARAIGEMLAKNKSLLYLDISNNEIGENGIMTIANGLKQNNTLKHFDFDTSSIRRGHFILTGAFSLLAEVLATHTSITNVRIPSPIGTDNVQSLANIFSKNKSIKGIAFNMAGIRQNDWFVVVQGLSQNSFIITLELNRNDLRGVGGQTLLKELLKRPLLKHLKLRRCMIDEQDLELLPLFVAKEGLASLEIDDVPGIDTTAVATLLSFNTSLKLLTVGNPLQPFSEGDFIAFASAIRQNKFLEILRLNTIIQDKHIKIISDALLQNGMLVDIRYANFKENTLITKYLTRNKNAHARAKESAMTVAGVSLKSFRREEDDDEEEDETTRMFRGLLKQGGRAGFRGFYFREMAYYLWQSRADPKWWTEEERKEAAEQTEKELTPSSKKRNTNNIDFCIQCKTGEAKFREKDKPSFMFCDSYCQWIKHNNAPDLRGKTPKQILQILKNLSN